jgi:hypothetical protein
MQPCSDDKAASSRRAETLCLRTVAKHPGFSTQHSASLAVDKYMRKYRRVLMSIEILEHVRKELTACGVVTSNKEFCVSWLARDESYLRVLRFHGLEPSADVLTTCASKLGYYAHHLSQSPNPATQDLTSRLRNMRALCEQALDQRARRKWMTVERMGL